MILIHFALSWAIIYKHKLHTRWLRSVHIATSTAAHYHKHRNVRVWQGSRSHLPYWQAYPRSGRVGALKSVCGRCSWTCVAAYFVPA